MEPAAKENVKKYHYRRSLESGHILDHILQDPNEFDATPRAPFEQQILHKREGEWTQALS